MGSTGLSGNWGSCSLVFGRSRASASMASASNDVLYAAVLGRGRVASLSLDHLDEMSSHLSVAVIAAEDQKFFNHHGFDVESIRESLVQAWDGTRVRGASTISQQVSKNLFLWPGRSLVRKGLEAYFTIFIELLWSKRRILEIYLNVVEFGDGIYGVATASDQFFDTVPALINAQQAALLAAVLPNPKVLKVDQPSAYVRERETWIRSQMRQLGESMLLEGLDAP